MAEEILDGERVKTASYQDENDTLKIVFRGGGGIVTATREAAGIDVAASCDRYAHDLADAIYSAYPNATIEVHIDETSPLTDVYVDTWGIIAGALTPDLPFASSATIVAVRAINNEVVRVATWMRVPIGLARTIFDEAITSLGLPDLGDLDVGPYIDAFPFLGETGMATVHGAWEAAVRGRAQECLDLLRSIAVLVDHMTASQAIHRLHSLSASGFDGPHEMAQLAARLVDLTPPDSRIPTAADTAVRFVLNRVQGDADLAWLICPGTESFAQLCTAEAALTGETVDAVRARRAVSRARYPRSLFKTGEGPAPTDATEIDLSGLTAGGLVELRDRIAVEISTRMSKYIFVEEDGVPTHAELPEGGALLHVERDVFSRIYVCWYPTLRAAQAALLGVADGVGKRIENDGMSVDLTEPGGAPAKAWVGGRS